MSDDKPVNHDEMIVGIPRKPMFSRLKKVLIFGVVVVAIAGLTMFLIRSRQNRPSQQAVRPVQVCSGPAEITLLNEAEASIQSDDILKLKQTNSKIQKLQGYEQDANCLYPVVIYYINISDAVNSRLYLNMLVKAYDPVKGFSPALGAARTLDRLKSNVKFLEDQLKTAEDNSDLSGSSRP